MEFKERNPETKIRVTPEMMKGFKTLTCECGGIIFESAMIFKKISALVTPTGKEELYPVEILVCKKCGKVPSELNVAEMLPEEIIAKKTIK